MDLERITEDVLRTEIKECEQEHHQQQVAYSTYHDGLTQVCFTCLAVRTTLPKA